MAIAKNKFYELESKLAEFLGKLYKEWVLFNGEIVGTVGEVYMTRAKDGGMGHNMKGYIDSVYIYERYTDTYEIVYQCRLTNGGKSHVLSLFPNQLEIVGKKVSIKEYSCVLHLFHRFIIGSDVEIYPVGAEIV